MKVETPMRRVVYLAALAGLAVSLVGCDSIRDAAGLTKISPDEFAVATKAPLIIPPDYNLAPPKPGAAPTNQISPTEQAEGALYGTRPSATTAQGPVSPGEQELLSKAGAADANDMIRQKIAADNRAMQASDEGFTNQLLFGMGSDHSQGTPVDADAEARRVRGAAPDTGSEPETPPKAQKGEMIQDAIGGWLDGIF